jgi:hypothetical protein
MIYKSTFNFFKKNLITQKDVALCDIVNKYKKKSQNCHFQIT